MGTEKKKIDYAFGPGGVNCPCCGGGRPRHLKRRIVRNIRRQDKKEAIKEGLKELES